MGKIRVTTQQAAEFIALGYTVEMWVQVDKQVELKTRSRKSNGKLNMIPMKTPIGLRIKSTGPRKGKYAAVWEQARKILWQDPLVTYHRSEVETALRTAGNTDGSMFSYLIRISKCIRVMPIHPTEDSDDK